MIWKNISYISRNLEIGKIFKYNVEAIHLNYENLEIANQINVMVCV